MIEPVVWWLKEFVKYPIWQTEYTFVSKDGCVRKVTIQERWGPFTWGKREYRP